jgi:hypothetical protein
MVTTENANPQFRLEDMVFQSTAGMPGRFASNFDYQLANVLGGGAVRGRGHLRVLRDHLERRPDGRGEDETMILPQGPGRQPILSLPPTVLPEGLHGGLRQRQRSPRPGRLDVGILQAACDQLLEASIPAARKNSQQSSGRGLE